VHDAAVRGDDLGADEVVAGETEATCQVADAATKGEAGHAGGGDDPAGGGEAVLVRGVVEVAPRGTTLGASRPLLRVHAHSAHTGQVDDHAVVDGSEAGHAVTSAADGDGQIALAGEIDGTGDISGVCGAHDHRGPLVDHGVVDGTGSVIASVIGADDAAADLFAQLVERGLGHE